MRPTRIWYKRLFNLGNFQHEEIGIEVDINAGETATHALKLAKDWVEGRNEEKVKKIRAKLENARRIVENPDDWKVRDVREAEETIRTLANQPDEEEPPF